MLDTATRTVAKYFTYYTEGIGFWWSHIGPGEYLGLLIGVLVLGYFLLRSAPMKSL